MVNMLEPVHQAVEPVACSKQVGFVRDSMLHNEGLSGRARRHSGGHFQEQQHASPAACAPG